MSKKRNGNSFWSNGPDSELIARFTGFLKQVLLNERSTYLKNLKKKDLKNTTILSSVRLNGETAYTIYQGGTTSERFTEYLKTVLIPTLEPDSVVVMDNMRSHHTEAVKSLLAQARVHYAYLPPYSPDLNPIEEMWSKIKAFLRKKKVRLAQDLPDAVRQAFDTITPQDCAGWFHSCGYSG